jgi:hypothetical protein
MCYTKSILYLFLSNYHGDHSKDNKYSLPKYLFLNEQDLQKDSYAQIYSFPDIHRLNDDKWIVNGILFISTIKLKEFALSHFRLGNQKHLLFQSK